MSLLKHMERWEDVKGYEGLYQVSNCGRVKSLKFGKEKILKPMKNHNGYFMIDLFKDSNRKSYRVHRLVAQAFLPNQNNYQCINHKNEKKECNYVWNLEWCDHKYNNNYGNHNKKVRDSLINREDQSKKIICIETNTVYNSISEAHRQTGINQICIIKCCKCYYGHKTAGGYHWKYTN